MSDWIKHIKGSQAEYEKAKNETEVKKPRSYGDGLEEIKKLKHHEISKESQALIDKFLNRVNGSSDE